MGENRQFLLFQLDNQTFALELAEVVRVYQAPAYSRPGGLCPPGVFGLVNIGGRRLPVLDLRARLGLPLRPPMPEDALIEALTDGQELTFYVDCIVGVRSFDDSEFEQGARLCPELTSFIHRVAEIEDGPVWIYGLKELLTEHDFSGWLVRYLDSQAAHEEGF